MMYVLAPCVLKGKNDNTFMGRSNMWMLNSCIYRTFTTLSYYLKPYSEPKQMYFISGMLFLFILLGPKMAESVSSSEQGVAGYD